MSLILNIDTTSKSAFVSLAEDGKIIDLRENDVQGEHATFLHPAIDDILKSQDIKIQDLDAIAASAGPGSYTGIRVSMATAKGLCYSAELPMISINQLEVHALDALNHIKEESAYICPMIDARRMEVFYQLYDENIKPLSQPAAMILSSTSFLDLAREKEIYFCGDGSGKFSDISNHLNFRFIKSDSVAASFSTLSYNKFITHQFSKAASSNALYIKDFYNG